MDLEELHEELDRIDEQLEAAELAVENLKEQLKPYWYARGKIEHEIRRTHSRRSDGALVFRFEGAPDRVPMFAALDALSAEWASVRADYRTADAVVSSYAKARRKLVNEIKFQTRKEARNDKGQGSLL